MNVKKTILLIIASAGVAVAGPSNGMFRVTTDRVNLRVRPVPDAEVVGQVATGTVVNVRRVEGDWAQIVPPTNIGVWVKATLVKDGVVTNDRVSVRGGPGTTFRDIGTVHRGTRLTALETRGDWLKCQPPEGVSLWISVALIVPVSPAVAPKPVLMSQAVPVAAPVAAPVTSVMPRGESGPGSTVLPPGLARQELAMVMGQGSIADYQGTVDRVPISFLHCSSYRLVVTDGGRTRTVCYLRGNDEQMPSFMGRRLAVRGREFWLKAEKVPLLYLDEVKPIVDQPAR